MTLSLRRFLILSLAALPLGAAAPLASAQIGGLPQQLVQSANLGDAERAQVRQFVEAHKPNLGSDDPLAVRRARAALEGPLGDPAVSIAFRIEYGRELLPVLESLARGDNELAGANAMHLAGELATPLAADLLIGDGGRAVGLNDKRAPVRHAAAFGLKRTFEHLQLTSPVFQERDARKVIDALAQRIGTETDPNVLVGYTRAFEAAVGVSQARVKGLRSAAAAGLAKSMGDLVRANRGNLDAASAMIRAAQVLRDAVVGQGLPANEPRLPQATLVEIAGFGGDLIATVRCRIANPGQGQLDRDGLAALAASGENVYYFAHSTLGSGEPLNLQLAQKVRDGRDQDLIQAADRYIGKTGVLTGQPFNLPAQRFECGQ